MRVIKFYTNDRFMRVKMVTFKVKNLHVIFDIYLAFEGPMNQ